MGIIFIGGLKHCGKSTLGRIVANALNYQFYDLDELILADTLDSWQSIRALWKDVGANEFALIEEDSARIFIEWTVPKLGGRGCVLSLGGGTIENAGAMAWIGKKGANIYIQADEQLLYNRFMPAGRPPFLSKDHSREDFARVYRHRSKLYEKFAHLIHTVDDSPPEINAQRLLVAMEKHHVR